MSESDDLQAELDRLRQENSKLKTKTEKTEGPVDKKAIRFKVGEKGGMSMYGLGRFPVTLYKGQWLTLLSHADDIRKFLEDNAASLKVKE